LARYVRAFTFDETTINAVGNLIEEGYGGMRLRILMKHEDPSVGDLSPLTLDDRDLSAKDYQELYQKLGISLEPEVLFRPKGLPVVYTKPPALTWVDFLKKFRADTNALTAREIHSEIRRRQKANHKAVKKNAAKVAAPVNASRVIDALVVLGLEALKEKLEQVRQRVTKHETPDVTTLATTPKRERVRGADDKGSAREDAGESSNELSNTSRRKKATVRAVPGGPQPSHIS
jgi:hypothetical protein